MMKVDWRKLPIVVPVIDHAQGRAARAKSTSSTAHRRAPVRRHRKIVHFDGARQPRGLGQGHREDGAHGLRSAQARHRAAAGLQRRCAAGSPIKGMQNRPPRALAADGRDRQRRKLRDAGMAPWRSALYADHYLAECVLVGGARRAARMSTKDWRDKTCSTSSRQAGGFLWSSNNSVTVDQSSGAT
jgi:hypothetical protein